MIYREDHTVSEVKTASYIVGFKEKTGYENRNVLSIVTDPYTLLDEEEGIYVLGNEFKEYLTEIDEDSKAKYWWWGDMDIPMKTNIRRFWGDGQYHRYQDKVYEVKTFFVERKKYIQTIANKYLY